MSKEIHLLDAYKSTLTEFFIHYGDCDDKITLNNQLLVLEIRLREKAYHLIRRSEYNPDDVLDVLDTLKDERFLEQGLEGVDFKNKEFLTTKLQTMFRSLRNYMGLLKNWNVKMPKAKCPESDEKK
jgi:hypothetical protein